jgi:tetratricopeptide (TPR) repeat protein
VLAVLMGLAAVGGLLSYYNRSERSGRAQRFYESGNRFLQKDLYDEAIEQYRDALSISHISQYRLALSLALEKAGHTAEATIYLKDVLRSDPTNAEANLGMARASAQEGRIDEAVGYYHHAIYGAWAANATQKRIEVRLELIQLLGKAARRPQAQAELLSLLALMPGDVLIKRQVAPLALEYALPLQAAGLFRDLTGHDAQDAQVWAGLGEADYALADYAAARDALETALRLNPNDTAVQKRLETCKQILALDPMQRGLSAPERYRRSQQLLAGVLDVLDNCAPSVLPPALRAQMDASRKLLANGRRTPSYGDAIENNISVAEQLWTAGTKACGSVPSADVPISRIMARLLAR